MKGGVVPGGMPRTAACEKAAICAMPAKTSAARLKENLDDGDAVVGLRLHVLDVADRRSSGRVRGRWRGGPACPAETGRCNCRTTPTTGILMFGKMSVGRLHNGHPAQDENEQRQHHEGVGPVEREPNNPHMFRLPSRSRQDLDSRCTTLPLLTLLDAVFPVRPETSGGSAERSTRIETTIGA